MITAMQFARLSALMEFPHDEVVEALVEDYGLTPERADKSYRTAVRERHELDITDTPRRPAREDPMTLDTPYTALSSDEFDWFSPEIEQEIAAAAARYGVDADSVHRALEAYIPDAQTPRESIDRAAFAVADRAAGR